MADKCWEIRKDLFSTTSKLDQPDKNAKSPKLDDNQRVPETQMAVD